MSGHMVRKIYDISNEYDLEEVVIITNHLKFMGKLCECDKEGKKDDDSLTLTDAKIWRLQDVCNCEEPECKCNEANFCSVDWLHINVSKIVAFSLNK